MRGNTNNLHFILGGNGFVGSAFVRFCEKTGKKFAVIGRQSYDEYVGKSCDVFINANGNSNKILATKDPIRDFDATVRTVRKSLTDFKFKKYVLISSCDVYPDCSSTNTTREDTEIDVAKQSPYGFHKYMAEECVKNGTSNWLVVRLGGMVGLGLKKNAIFDIINGGPLWLDPQSELQYMPTDDVARIVFELIQKDVRNEIFNICGKGLVRLQYLLDKYKATVTPNSPKVRYYVNIEKISRATETPDSMKSVMDFIEEKRK